MTFDQIINLLEVVPSIVLLLAAAFFIFMVSLHDLESRILPANSKRLYFNSIATMCIYLLGFLLGTFAANWEIIAEETMHWVSVVVLLIVILVLMKLILASKNRTNLFKDKIFSVFKSDHFYLIIFVILPFGIGFFSYFLMANGKPESILISILVLITLLLFIGKASVHNGLDDSLRRFYFNSEYKSLFGVADLEAFLISENESFFFIVKIVEKDSKGREKKKEETIIAVNKSMVYHYEIASLKNTEDK